MDNASWAMREFLLLNGRDTSGDLLFGLSNSATYRIEGETTDRVLRVLSERRIERMFQALHISVEIYYFLCDRAIAAYDLDPVGDCPVLFRLIERGGAGGLGEAEEVAGDRYVWVTRDNGACEGRDWPMIRVQDQDRGTRLLTGESFAQAMSLRWGRWTRYVFWIPLARSVQYDEKHAVRAGIRRHWRTMKGGADSGLDVLERAVAWMRSGVPVRIDAAAVESRRGLASFFAASSELLELEWLRGVAARYEQIASLWGGVVRHQAAGDAVHAAGLLQQIRREEYEAMAMVDRGLRGEA